MQPQAKRENLFDWKIAKTRCCAIVNELSYTHTHTHTHTQPVNGNAIKLIIMNPFRAIQYHKQVMKYQQEVNHHASLELYLSLGN